jgi:hydroxypyruvate reductase
MSATHLHADAVSIREAAIDAVRPEVLVPRRLTLAGDRVLLDGGGFDPAVTIGGRTVVVGGGKAAAGMAAAIERLLAPAIAAGHPLKGLVSVPVGCGLRLDRIEVRETRPPAVNLPTPAAVEATRTMREMLAELGPADLAVVLVTGGGSAALAEPRAGVSLDDKVAVTSFLAAAGAGIRELNAVRQALSAVKAGGLARGCTAGRLLAIVLSDVIGDSLESIASGPCMPGAVAAPAALEVLRRYRGLDVVPSVTRLLDHDAAGVPHQSTGPDAGDVSDVRRAGEWTTPHGCRVSHLLLGTNATAIDAAAARARDLGYEVTLRQSRPGDPFADAVGSRLADEAAGLLAAARAAGRPQAVIEGGEAVVCLPPDHGLGGRNQQTVLAAFEAWRRCGRGWPEDLLIASIGTDGEDGPTDAAGGFVDTTVAARLVAGGIDVPRAVARCDAYPALQAADGLVRTGPTGTNVADVRLILARAAPR